MSDPVAKQHQPPQDAKLPTGPPPKPSDSRQSVVRDAWCICGTTPGFSHMVWCLEKRITDLEALLRDAVPYMRAANMNAGPIDEWLAAAKVDVESQEDEEEQGICMNCGDEMDYTPEHPWCEKCDQEGAEPEE